MATRKARQLRSLTEAPEGAEAADRIGDAGLPPSGAKLGAPR